ncbi:MAG TPA: hypothetical protein VGX97_07405 [bacterium]|nr:hypothetical protein [bacterium]
MRIGRSKLARILMVAAVLMALTMPGTIVFAHDGGGHGGHDADGGHHDAADGSHGGADKGGGETAGGGSHRETSSPDAGKNGDTIGDLRSNMHTGARGRGAGGDDKLELGAGTTGGTTAGAPAHAAPVAESPRSGAGGATPGAAGAEVAHAGVAAGAPGVAGASGGAAGASGGAVAPGGTAAAPPSVPVLGAEQTAIGPATPGQRMVLGAQQTRPRTLPFTGLSAAWAMLISRGRWAGVLLGLLGLAFLVRGFRRA